MEKVNLKKANQKFESGLNQIARDLVRGDMSREMRLETGEIMPVANVLFARYETLLRGYSEVVTELITEKF